MLAWQHSDESSYVAEHNGHTIRLTLEDDGWHLRTGGRSFNLGYDLTHAQTLTEQYLAED